MITGIRALAVLPTTVVGLVLAVLGPAAPARAAETWLDPAFAGDGTVRQSYAGDIASRVVGSAKASDGGLVLGLEPAHTMWGCCLARVGGWGLAKVTAGGAPVTGFGVNGVVAPSKGAAPGSVDSFIPNAMDLDTSDRVLLVGRVPDDPTDKQGVLRTTAAGAPDLAFGTKGFATLGKPAACANSLSLEAVLAQDTGKILVVGRCLVPADPESHFALVVGRLTSSGALDTSFGPGGYRTVTLPAAVGACCGVTARQLADGRLVVGMGSNQAAVVRLLATGAPDTTFSGDGIALVGNDSYGGADRILAGPDGRVLVNGPFGKVYLLDSSGTLVPRAGDDPDRYFSTPDTCGYPTIIDLTGTIDHPVAAIQCLQGVGLSALNANGSPDTSYGVHPSTVRSTPGQDIFQATDLFVPDGSGLLLAGADATNGVRVERRLASGGLDTSYGTHGGTHLDVRGRLFSLSNADAARDPQGRLVTVAEVDNRTFNDEGAVAVTRFLPNGSPDPAFGSGGTTVVETGGHAADEGESTDYPRVLINSDGSITLVAPWTNHWPYTPAADAMGLWVARLTSSGDLDTDTIPGGSRVVTVPGLTQEVFTFSLAHGAGGTTLAGVALDSVDGPQAAVVRLLPSGALDTSYAVNGVRQVPDVASSGNPQVQLAELAGGATLLTWREYTDDIDDAFVAAKVTSGGSLDATYGSNGRYRVPYPGNVVVHATPSGKALLAWTVRRHPDADFDYSADVHVRRLTAAGVVDTTFGAQGQRVITPPAASVGDRIAAIDSSGEEPLVLYAETNGDSGNTDALLRRLTADGDLDTGFGGDGKVAVASAQNNVIGIGVRLIGVDNGPTSIVTTTYGPQSGDPTDLSVVRVLDKVVRLDGPRGTVLTATATFSWHGLTFPVTVETTMAMSDNPFDGWVEAPPTNQSSANVALVAGASTCVRVRDSTGTLTPPACVTSPFQASALTRAGTWKEVTGAAFYRGSALRSKDRGATLKATVQASTLELVASTCARCGAVKVLFHGTKVGKISLDGPTRRHVIFPIADYASVQSGVVTLKLTSGKKVIIEGLTAGRDDVS